MAVHGSQSPNSVQDPGTPSSLDFPDFLYAVDGAVMVDATLAALLGAAFQTRLPPSFPAAFGGKYVVSMPVALGGPSGPDARDAAATELEGLFVFHVGAFLVDEAVGYGLYSTLVWAVAHCAFVGAMNVVLLAAAEIVMKGAVIVFLVLVLLELVKVAAELVLKGLVFIVLVPVLLELVNAAAETGLMGIAPEFLEAAASFLGKTLGVSEFPGHIWKGDRKNEEKRFFRVQTSGKCEDQVSSFGILGNVNVAHTVRELWMERQENYICGKLMTAAACRAAAFEGVVPFFLGFPVPVFVYVLPVQAVATRSVGIMTMEGETDRSPSQEPFGSLASRSLGQQEDSGKVSQDEKFQVFVQGAGLGSATRVLWVTAHTTVADACAALGLTDVVPSDVYGSIGSKLLGWNDGLAQGGACKGSRLVLFRRTRGGGGPRQPLYDEWTCARCAMAGCWATKRSCFRCGLPRAESERILRSNPKGRIRNVPPREEYFMGRPSPFTQKFDPPTKSKKGSRPTSQPAGGQGKDVLQLDQVLGLLRAIGIDSDLMDDIKRRIEVKTKASEKSLSEIVAELEAKERRACNHSIHLQRVVDSKKKQLAEAETRLQAHLVEHEQLKEQLAKAQAKQYRHLSGNPYDPDEVYESSCEIQEISGGEEEEEEEADDESGMEDITTEEMFADVPHEDYVQNSSSLPAEGKGGPPPPTVVGGVQFCDKADKAKVKKFSLKKKPASSKALCG